MASVDRNLRSLVWFSATCVACVLPVFTASSEPWLAPGQSALRSDLTALADAGVLRAPMTTWPLPWADIAADTREAAVANLDAAELAALERVRARALWETRLGEWAADIRATAADSPTLMRTFERTPRSDGELAAGLSRTGSRLAFRLNAERAWDAADGDTVRLDGSYVGLAVGNWMLSAGYPERWWGPGWDGSLILSTNARPPPQLAVNRNLATPFRPRWLGWVGPWSLTSFLAQLDDERVVEEPLLFGVRVSAKPFQSLEVGLSRTAMLCGDGRDCSGRVFFDMLIGNDNIGVNVAVDEEPGNQLAGFDLRWALPFERASTALYMQWIGEDSRQGGPQVGSWLRSTGAELSGDLFDGEWRHRSYFELADTVCQEGGGGFGGDKFTCAYTHSIYQTGYRYKGRSIGHGIDGDGLSVSAGSTLIHGDREWRFSARRVDLNRNGSNPGHTLSAVPRRVDELTVSYSRPLGIGTIRASLGVRDSDGATDPPLDDQSVFGWVEFVLN